MSKYYSYMFYADRNVRPCTILGYTLTTFPKSLIQTKRQKEQLHQIASHRRRRTLQQQQDKASDTLTSQSSNDSILPDYGSALKTFTAKDPSSVPKKLRYSL